MSEDLQQDSQSDATHTKLEHLFSEGELNEQVLKEKAKKVRRTMRRAKHFSRQENPLKRSRSLALKSIEELKTLASFDKGVRDGDWSVFAKLDETIADCINPFYAFYRSHGKLPEIDLEEAVAYVLYVGIVHGRLDIGVDIEMSRDTPRGSYP